MSEQTNNGGNLEPETEFIQPGIDDSGYTDSDAYVVGADSAEYYENSDFDAEDAEALAHKPSANSVEEIPETSPR